jgi:hypothetical protein
MSKSSPKKKRTETAARPAAPARPKVVLIERAGRLQPFNLPHHEYCAAGAPCTCTVRNVPRTERDPRTKGTYLREVEVRTPKSITLLPRRESEPLDAAVLECTEIKKAIPRRLGKREL